nr:terminase small subunit [Niallia circulans]
MYHLKYFNATKAYQKAYGCAYSTAMVEGHRHLRNPKIAREIDRIKEEQMNELKLGAKDVLQKYIDIAFADATDFAKFGKKEVKRWEPLVLWKMKMAIQSW